MTKLLLSKIFWFPLVVVFSIGASPDTAMRPVDYHPWQEYQRKYNDFGFVMDAAHEALDDFRAFYEMKNGDIDEWVIILVDTGTTWDQDRSIELTTSSGVYVSDHLLFVKAEEVAGLRVPQRIMVSTLDDVVTVDRTFECVRTEEALYVVAYTHFPVTPKGDIKSWSIMSKGVQR